MDFFSSKAQIQETTSQTENSESSSFARAIGRRFTAPQPPHPPLPTSIPELTLPHRSFVTPALSALSIPLAASTPGIPITGPRRTQHAPALDAAKYTELSPSQLPHLSQDGTLIVDIRPYQHFHSSRLPNAISLNLPSILLKRSSTDWNKITAAITEPAALQRFSHWRATDTLLVLDTDTTVLAESNILLCLLRKFRTAGYSGNLCWVKGGMTAVYKEAPSIVEQGGTSSADNTSTTGTITSTSTPRPAPGSFLCPRDLPLRAFQGTSTTMKAPSSCETTTSFTAANPFYDNIRQNAELANGVGDKIPLLVSDRVSARRNDLPFQWLRDLLLQAESPDHGAEMLALQFYRIEVGEQRRLQGIMSHHCRQSDDTRPRKPPFTAPPTQFPFSITAGIEMGTKNRYRNIWPFEHARVRLRTISVTDASDYFNASYVQPIITRRRYIATQGPLATTFNDFWTIVWEQNVPVIVMLTREVEGNHVKSDCYWKDGQYGHLQLKLEEQVGATDVGAISRNQGGFNFGSTPVMDTASDAIIKRVFTLRNAQQPHVPPRKIVHLQYLGWPDLNVPESTRGVLDLIKHVNSTVANTSPSPGEETEPGPIMLHCSAGVGRTGGFILIDAMLDGIRREIRKAVQRLSLGRNDLGTSLDAMDLDEPEVFPTLAAQHAQHGRSLDVAATRDAAPFASTTSFDSDASDAMRKSSKPSSSGPGLSNKQQRLSHALAEKLVNAEAASNQSLSNAATITAWSAGLPSPSSGYASSGNGNIGGHGSVKGSEGKSPSNSPSPPDFYGDENDIYFKVPRKLHQTDSPPLLSTLREPIREVLEDMREQRMSLCQSLRQYVFAHRVILEGALEVVDEEEFLRQRRLGRVDEGKRVVQPWDVLRQCDGHEHRHRESTSSFMLRSSSQPLNFWSSTSSFSSLPDDAGSSAAASSAARQSDTNSASLLTPAAALSRSMQPHRVITSPSATTNALPVLTSPMKDLSIDLSSSPYSRHMAGRLSQERPRTPGSVAIGVPPPALTGKRSHSPSKWERKINREVNATLPDERENDESPLADGQHFNERPSVKRRLQSDDTVDASTILRGKFGPGVGITALNP